MVLRHLMLAISALAACLALPAGAAGAPKARGSIRLHVRVPGPARADAAIDVRLNPGRWCGTDASACLQSVRATATPTSAAWIAELEPDSYDVRVSLDGFRAADGRVQVGAGDTLVLTTELVREAPECRTKPGAKTPPGLESALACLPGKIAEVDRFRSSVGTAYTDDAFSGLPSSHNAWSLLETVEPSAILDRIDGPGLYPGEPGRFSLHGASWTQNAFVIDGLDVTDPLRGGTPLVQPDVDAFRVVDLTSALAPVEYGVPGVTLALVPRDPPEEWRGMGQVAGLPTGVQGDPASGKAPPIARFGSLFDLHASVGGPARDGRLRLLFSTRFARVVRFESEKPTERKGQMGSLFSHAVYRASDRDTLSASVTAESLTRPSPARARFGDAAVNERADALGAQIRWERDTGERRWTAFAGYHNGLARTQSEGFLAGSPIDRLQDGPVPELVLPGSSRRANWTLGGRLALRASRFMGLTHLPRLGASLDGAWVEDTPGEQALTPERVDGSPARVWDYGWPGTVSRRHLHDLVAYAADRLAVGERLTVEAGLRFDGTRGSAEGASQGITWGTLSPRISARLLLSPTGRVALFGGYGEYRHRLLLDHLAFGDPTGPQGSVYRWNDRDGDRLFDEDERGVLVARVGPGAADGLLSSIDPDVRPPRTREWVVGLEGRLRGDLTLSLTGFHRRERDLLESTNIGVTSSDYRLRQIPDPAGDLDGTQDDQALPVYDRLPASFGRDRYLLTNAPGHEGLHEGVELRLTRDVGKRLFLFAGATASRTELMGANRGFHVIENDQGVIGELFDNPNADTHAKGRSFFDRAFTIKIASSYRAPRDVRLGLVARYQDGQAFARYVVVGDLAQGPEAIPAVPRGQIARDWALNDGLYVVPSGHRFEYTLTLDARIEKTVRWRGRRVLLFCEGFNLLDMRHEMGEYVIWNEDFRVPTLVQPPRVLVLGARVDF